MNIYRIVTDGIDYRIQCRRKYCFWQIWKTYGYFEYEYSESISCFSKRNNQYIYKTREIAQAKIKQIIEKNAVAFNHHEWKVVE